MFHKSYLNIFKSLIFYMVIVLLWVSAYLDGRRGHMWGVPGDKIDDDHYYYYHDSTDSKMWQDSLPHKKAKFEKFFGLH